MSPANPSDQRTQLRQVIERLVGDGTVVARSDGTVHDLFPVAIGPTKRRAASGSHANVQPGPGPPPPPWRHRARRRLPAPGGRRAASFFLTNLNWTLEAASPADELHQWAALRTSAVPETRSFDDYVEF